MFPFTTEGIEIETKKLQRGIMGKNIINTGILSANGDMVKVNEDKVAYKRFDILQ